MAFDSNDIILLSRFVDYSVAKGTIVAMSCETCFRAEDWSVQCQHKKCEARVHLSNLSPVCRNVLCADHHRSCRYCHKLHDEYDCPLVADKMPQMVLPPKRKQGAPFKFATYVFSDGRRKRKCPTCGLFVSAAKYKNHTTACFARLRHKYALLISNLKSGKIKEHVNNSSGSCLINQRLNTNKIKESVRKKRGPRAAGRKPFKKRRLLAADHPPLQKKNTPRTMNFGQPARYSEEAVLPTGMPGGGPSEGSSRSQSAPPLFPHNSFAFGVDVEGEFFKAGEDDFSPNSSPKHFVDQFLNDIDAQSLSPSLSRPEEGVRLKILRNKIEELQSTVKLLEESIRHEEERTKLTVENNRARYIGRILKLEQNSRMQESSNRQYAKALFKDKEMPTHALLIADICLKLEKTLQPKDSMKMQEICSTVTGWLSSSSDSAKN